MPFTGIFILICVIFLSGVFTGSRYRVGSIDPDTRYDLLIQVQGMIYGSSQNIQIDQKST